LGSKVDPFLKSDVFSQLGIWFTAVYSFLRDVLIPFLRDEFFSFLSNVAWPILVNIVNAVGGALGSLFNVITNNWTQIEAILTNLGTAFSNVIVAISGLVGPLAAALLPVAETFSIALLGVSEWIKNVLSPDLQAFFGAFGGWWTSEVDPFLQSEVFPTLGIWLTALYGFIRDEILPFLSGPFWTWVKTDLWEVGKGIIDDLWNALKGLWDTVNTHSPELQKAIVDLIEAFGKTLVGKIEMVGAFLEAKSGDIMGSLDTIWTSESLTLWQKIQGTLGVGAVWAGQQLQALGEFLSPVFTALGSLFGALWNVVETIYNLFKPAIDLVGGILGGVFSVAITLVAGLLNTLAYAINVVLWPFQMLATAIHNIIEFIMHPFNPDARDNWEYPAFPTYAPMAEGGLIRKPTFVLAGEAGPELFTPLDKLGSLSNSIGGDNRTVEIHVHVGNEKLAKYVMKGLKNANVYDTGFALSPMGG
jgi:hypothetical protein